MFSLRHCSQLVVVCFFSWRSQAGWVRSEKPESSSCRGRRAGNTEVAFRDGFSVSQHWGKSWTAVSQSHYIQNFCNMVFSMSKSGSYQLTKPMTRNAGLLLISMQEGIRNQAVTEWNIPCPTSFIHRQEMIWSPIKPRPIFFSSRGRKNWTHYSLFMFLLNINHDIKVHSKRFTACQSWNSLKLHSFAFSKVPFFTNSGPAVNLSLNILDTAATFHPSIRPPLLFSHSFVPCQKIFPNRRLQHDLNDNATLCDIATVFLSYWQFPAL